MKPLQVPACCSLRRARSDFSLEGRKSNRCFNVGAYEAAWRGSPCWWDSQSAEKLHAACPEAATGTHHIAPCSGLDIERVLSFLSAFASALKPQR